MGIQPKLRTGGFTLLEMLTVDDFPFDEFARNKDTLIDHNPA